MSLFTCSPYINQASPFLMPFLLSSWQIFGKKGQKLDFICSSLCFLGKIGGRKGQNLRYILVLRIAGLPLGLSLCGGGGVHRVQVVGAFEAQDLPEVGCGPLVVCSLVLSALSLCLWCVVLEICLYSRFKGVFSAVWGCCVGLCCSGALRGLCGFCTRE